ncbi:hypothetical protein [Mycobacterium sp. IS-836]|uniref:hypothetical protein n=1 Tax=Mycobacterium sp. IS-836 TaxID=1834160 RepID=UPI001153AFF2|nr:hypothetical protein [Mycobacterium sp. IS-836]
MQILPTVRTWYGVQYPDLNRVVRVASEVLAHETAAAYPGAIAVSCCVSDWLPIKKLKGSNG